MKHEGLLTRHSYFALIYDLYAKHLLLVIFQVLTAACMKETAFWDIAISISSSLMMEAVRTSETRSTPTRVHGATSKKTLNFILAAVRT
jgi:hypothetical protein